MNRFVYQVSRAAQKSTNLATQIICITLVAWLATVLLVVDRPIVEISPKRLLILLVLFAVILAVSLFYSFLTLREDNYRLKSIFKEFHEINHFYRNILSMLCEINSAENTESKYEINDLLGMERNCLAIVCQKIAKIFQTITGRECFVTLVLLVEQEEKKMCVNWANSDLPIKRTPVKTAQLYPLNSGEFPGLDIIFSGAPPPHCVFYSPDLNQDSRTIGIKYSHFKSILAVPIRSAQINSDNPIETIGALIVDTQSTYRLNTGYHLNILSSFADQMYNFISILRGNYITPNLHEDDSK